MARSFSAWSDRQSQLAFLLTSCAVITGCGSLTHTPRSDSAVDPVSTTSPDVPSQQVASAPFVPITAAAPAPAMQADPGVPVKDLSEASQSIVPQHPQQKPEQSVSTSTASEVTPILSPTPPHHTASPASAADPVSPAAANAASDAVASNLPKTSAPALGTTAGQTVQDKVVPLEHLANLMCGEFSSADQAARDPDYRDISLKIARIWPQSNDGIWLYVEQAVAAMADRPYRQRIYHLTAVPNTKVPTFRSDVFTLPGDLRRFIGAWQHPGKLADFTPALLTIREGCAVILTQTGPNSFSGSTVDRNCQSEFQRASYATSEVIITPQSMVSWDRGFDNDGKQVWGATNGGYNFTRITPTSGPGATPEK